MTTILSELVRFRDKKANQKEYRRKYILDRYHARKAATRQMIENIPNLPDDDRELWLRPVPDL